MGLCQHYAKATDVQTQVKTWDFGSDDGWHGMDVGAKTALSPLRGVRLAMRLSGVPLA